MQAVPAGGSGPEGGAGAHLLKRRARAIGPLDLRIAADAAQNEALACPTDAGQRRAAGRGPDDGAQQGAPPVIIQGAMSGQRQGIAVETGEERDPAQARSAPGGDRGAAGVAEQGNGLITGRGERQAADVRDEVRRQAHIVWHVGAGNALPRARHGGCRRLGQGERRGDIVSGQREAEPAPLGAGCPVERAAGAQDEAEPIAHGGEKSVALAAETGPAAIVDQHGVEPAKRGGVDRYGRIAQQHAAAYADAAGHVEAGIRGPAAKIFDFRAGGARQKEEPG